MGNYSFANAVLNEIGAVGAVQLSIFFNVMRLHEGLTIESTLPRYTDRERRR